MLHHVLHQYLSHYLYILHQNYKVRSIKTLGGGGGGQKRASLWWRVRKKWACMVYLICTSFSPPIINDRSLMVRCEFDLSNPCFIFCFYTQTLPTLNERFSRHTSPIVVKYEDASSIGQQGSNSMGRNNCNRLWISYRHILPFHWHCTYTTVYEIQYLTRYFWFRCKDRVLYFCVKFHI
jgi:hypothetical protein